MQVAGALTIFADAWVVLLAWGVCCVVWEWWIDVGGLVGGGWRWKRL